MATSVLVNPANMATLYVDNNSFTTFSHVIGRSLTAYNDDVLGAQDLTLGASSNVMIEGMDSISMYTKDSGNGIKVFTTTYNAATDTRTDKQILGVQQNALSNTTIITAPENNMVALQSSDTYKTVKAGDMSLYTSNDTQYLATTATRGFVFEQSLRTDDSFVAGNHLFGKDIVGYSNTGLTGVDDITEAGFCLRMNDDLQIEMIKYGKVVLNAQGSTKKVYKRVGIFGAPAITSNMDNDTGLGAGGYDPFADLANLLAGVVTNPPLSLPILNLFGISSQPTVSGTTLTAWGILAPENVNNKPMIANSKVRFAGAGLLNTSASLPNGTSLSAGFSASISFNPQTAFIPSGSAIGHIFNIQAGDFAIDMLMQYTTDGFGQQVTMLICNIICAAGVTSAIISPITTDIWHTMHVQVTPGSVPVVTFDGAAVVIPGYLQRNVEISDLGSTSYQLYIASEPTSPTNGIIADFGNVSVTV